MSAHTVLWSVIDVSGSGRHPSTYVFLLVLLWVHGSFAFPYSQVDVDIIKFNHYSIVGSNSQNKVTFVSISVEFQITEALESITRLSWKNYLIGLILKLLTSGNIVFCVPLPRERQAE